MHCGSKYTPEPKPRGFPDEVRKQALQLYAAGLNLRRIGRHMSIHYCTVSLWVKPHAANLPDALLPEEVKEAGMDELFTFIGHKKQDLRPHARRPAYALLFGLESGLGTHSTSHSRCGRRGSQGQMLYHISDAFDAYDHLWYHLGK